YFIDREIRTKNGWPKPSGISLSGRTVAVVGFGDIGRQTAKRILACDANVIAYDPFFKPADGISVENASWPDRLGEADVLIFTCPLTPETRHMFNKDLLPKLKRGVRVVNVARGPVIDETALLDGLNSGIVDCAALDVFEVEPLAADHPLRTFDRCIFGSHNGSNSADAVRRVSRIAIGKMADFLGTASA
ncbi:MAG: NAD(P)-dependent oxidoreductase, partial [Pseudomonadota bacterium]